MIYTTNTFNKGKRTFISLKNSWTIRVNMTKNHNWKETTENHDYHNYKNLAKSEKFTISVIYWRKWRKYVQGSKLNKNKKMFFKIYFKEIHALYYLTVLKGSKYVTVDRLIKNFFVSRVNENMRIILQSFNSINLTSFIHGIRSQIETNALLNKFITDEEYFKKFILLNEDRSKIKELDTTININTLVQKIDSEHLDYLDKYNELSLLLHPNPSAVAFYSQAEKTKDTEETGMAEANLSYYFNETITQSPFIEKWFDTHIWFFLTTIEHFLILYVDLQISFYINEEESINHRNIDLSVFVSKHKKEILVSVNKAVREGKSTEEAINNTIKEILRKKT